LDQAKRIKVTVSHGQTFNSPPAKPGDYLVYLIHGVAVAADLCDNHVVQFHFPARQIVCSKLPWAMHDGHLSAWIAQHSDSGFHIMAAMAICWDLKL
ncbi:hypothetical protein, partial [Nitrosomonas sp. Nm33]|uniref:hypothetical protein n=1 Tax=Nitrosomonas sp. Nm33 TaxID=133724 RepID=UPI000894210A